MAARHTRTLCESAKFWHISRTGRKKLSIYITLNRRLSTKVEQNAKLEKYASQWPNVKLGGRNTIIKCNIRRLCDAVVPGLGLPAQHRSLSAAHKERQLCVCVKAAKKKLKTVQKKENGRRLLRTFSSYEFDLYCTLKTIRANCQILG